MRAERASFTGRVPVGDPSVTPSHESLEQNFCEWKTDKKLQTEDLGQK